MSGLTAPMKAVLAALSQGRVLSVHLGFLPCGVERAYLSTANSGVSTNPRLATVRALRRRRLIAMSRWTAPGSRWRSYHLTRQGWKQAQDESSER